MSKARADEQTEPEISPFAAHIEGGLVVPLGATSDSFNLGGGARLGLEYRLLPFLGVEGHGSFDALKKSPNLPPSTSNWGSFSTLGAGARVHFIPKSLSDDLWATVDASAVFTGNTDRFGAAVGVGYEHALARVLSVGPFGRYQRVFHADGLPGEDAQVLVLGLAISLRPPPTMPPVRKPPPAPPPPPPPPPVLDSDGDGILDDIDKCPSEPEDKDGFQDEDGCPDPDNDGDGILDGADKCPNEAETKNGFEDEDGCPDIKPTKLDALAKRVQFKYNSAALESASDSAIAEVAQYLKEETDITRVEVAGHTDDRGNAAFNKTLSEKRAQAIVDALAKAGISRTRLTAVGYGSAQPLQPGTDDAAREANRRVEFKVLEGKERAN